VVAVASDLVELNCVELPDRAGELQRARARAALVREVGDNYASYHDFLQRRLAELGGRPDPVAYAGDPTAYGEHAHEVQRVVASEIFLRRGWSHRKQGRGLGASLADLPPLWDADGRLVDVEHPERSRFHGPLTGPPQAAFPPPSA
jgi:hypothetical protein